jgi:cell volume regulation protein A
VELGLPEESIIALIIRDEEYLIPRGTTVLEAGDVLLMMLDKASVSEVHRILSAPRHTG